MRGPNYILLIDGILAVLVTLDLARVLKTGRARTWMTGTVTRAHQPAQYWRYVYQSWAMLVLCAVVVFWAVLWPDSLR